jgi:hypothetical protein
VSGISDRAEQIGAAVVAHVLGAEAVPRGRDSAMDYWLRWPDERMGALKVTLVAHPEAIGWQNQIAERGGTWPAAGKWELRLRMLAIQHRPTMTAALKAVDLCNEHGVDAPTDLPASVRAGEAAVVSLETVGDLRRVRLGREGVTVFEPTRAEFIDATSDDFADVLERWARLEHVADHVAKTAAESANERHLCLVAVDDVLPVRFFADDFAVPARFPDGYEGIDGLWVWSNYWHRVMGWRNGSWAWHDTPTGR